MDLFAQLGPALALACGIRDFHTVDESIREEDLSALARLVMAVLDRLGS